ARVFWLIRKLESTWIGLRLVHADADVVILLIRKQNPIVTVVALDRLKDIPPTNRTLAHRALIARAPAIERRVATDDCPLKRSDRHHHVLCRRVALKHSLKLRLVILQRIYLRDDLARVYAHTHVCAHP